MIIGSILCAASTLHFYNIFSIMFSSTRKTHCVVDREAVKRLHTQKGFGPSILLQILILVQTVLQTKMNLKDRSKDVFVGQL